MLNDGHGNSGAGMAEGAARTRISEAAALALRIGRRRAEQLQALRGALLCNENERALDLARELCGLAGSAGQGAGANAGSEGAGHGAAGSGR